MASLREYLLYLYAESPVHAGAAGSEGLLDLPIQRESSTGYPVIWGQSLKGALRQAADDARWGALVSDVFGPTVGENPGEGLDAGRLVVGDAQLVAMPVATLERTFAWVTTGPALGRLARKYRRLGLDAPPIPGTPPETVVALGPPWAGNEHVVLGPCVASVTEAPGQQLRQWAERVAGDGVGDGPGLEPFRDKLRQDLLLVGDSVASPLLTQCTELSVRVQLESEDPAKRKTVKHGPFHTEYLPTETVLAASLTLRTPPGGPGQDPAPAALERLIHGKLHQIGGDETIGKGLVWCQLIQAPAPGPGAEPGPSAAGGKR